MKFQLFFLFSFILTLVSPVMTLNSEISTNQEHIWKVDTDDSVYEDFQEGVNIPDDFLITPSIEGFKIAIKNTEKNNSDYNFDIEFFTTQAFLTEEWEKEQAPNEMSVIGYDKDIYSESGFLSDMIYCTIIFVPTDVDWDELQDEIDKSLGNDPTIDSHTVSSTSNGIGITFQYEEDVEIGFNISYNAEGIMEYYQLTFNGDTVTEITLYKEDLIFTLWIIIIIVLFSGLLSVYAFLRHKRKTAPKPKKKVKQRLSERGTISKDDIQAVCKEIYKDDEIPKKMRDYISEQKSLKGLIKRKDILNCLKREKTIYCRFEKEKDGKNMVLKCYELKIKNYNNRKE